MKATRRGEREKGQVSIEFALAMPFLMMFLLFLIDLALFGYSYVSVTNAVREGARCGVVGGTDAAISARVEAASGGLSDLGEVDTTRGVNVGDDIEVQAQYTYNWITPIGLVPGISGSTSYNKAVVMRMEVSGAPAKDSCP